MASPIRATALDTASPHTQMAPVRDPRRWLVLAIVSLALLLIVIDMTVLYTALPRLTHDLAASSAEKLWILNIYSLVVAGLLPGTGTLGDRVGHRRLFCIGLAVFGVASLAAAFSPTPGALIGARVLLAVGAALMMPATLSIIRLTFDDEHERGVAIGIWAAIAAGGAAVGPVVGGLLLNWFWWGSVFLINVPLVLVSLWLAWRLVPAARPPGGAPWDVRASLLIMAGLLCVVFSVQELGRHGGQPLLALGAALAGLALLAWFARFQRRRDPPLLDFSLMRQPRFAAGVAGAVCAAVALIGIELVVTQRLQLVNGLTPLYAALALLPLPLAAFLVSPLAGYLLPRLGAQRLMAAALLLSALGAVCLAVWQQDTGLFRLAGLVMLGVGLGSAMTGASSAIMSSAPAHRAGMAASMEEVAYELGGALGVAVMGSLLSAVYALRLTLPGGAVADPSLHDSLDHVLLAAETLPLAEAAPLVAAAQHAFDQGYVAVLVTSALIMSVAAVWILRRRGEGEVTHAGH